MNLATPGLLPLLLLGVSGWTAVGWVWAAQPALSAPQEGPSLIVNGGFEQDADGDGVPDGWTTAGRRGVVQKLQVVEDPLRGRVARLECTQFEPGFPDSHAMMAQLGRISLQRGQWYRLRLWARAENLQTGDVQIAVANIRTWQETGLRDSLTPTETWQQYELYGRATADLAPADSRLQIWLTGPGVLYVDDLELVPVADFRPRRLPEISWLASRNALPNSSFELGGIGWGCYAPRLSGWGSHVFFRYGAVDQSRSKHGRASWRLTLDLASPLVSYFDYFDPRGELVDCLLLASEGWVPVQPGQPYVFTCWVVADQPQTPVLLLVNPSSGPRISRKYLVGTDWTLLQLPFTTGGDAVWVGVGPDLSGGERTAATLWIDAVQLAAGHSPPGGELSYEPRQPLEASVELGGVPALPGGSIFPTGQPVTIGVCACNYSAVPRELEGKLWVTDYRGQVVWEGTIARLLPPESCQFVAVDDVPRGRKGFFRVHFARADSSEVSTRRLAIIDPYPPGEDTAFGMNHAFGWPELIRLAHLAGVGWWRDWSTQWRLVQPQPEAPFDFALPRLQIERVLACGGKVLMLLPFPGTPWAVDVDNTKLEQAAGGNRYLATRLVLAYKPRDPALFARYVEAAVRHFWPKVDTIEILNEPLFTSYALPASHGHTMEDYLQLLRVGYEAAKSVSPQVRVVGGVAAPPDHGFVRQFVEAGGPQWCDVVNLHLYPHRGDPMTYDPLFGQLGELMAQRGVRRPIWVTEFGLYADDDPAASPFRVGDATMSRTLRPSERRASADLVKFAALMRAAGVEKIFYHAGTCGAWNEDSAGNIFFEWGGAPRMMLPAQAALSQMLKPSVRFLRRWGEPAGLVGLEFVDETSGRHVAVLWAAAGALSFTPPPGWQALDLMGNPIEQLPLLVDQTPVYLIRDQ